MWATEPECRFCRPASDSTTRDPSLSTATATPRPSGSQVIARPIVEHAERYSSIGHPSPSSNLRSSAAHNAPISACLFAAGSLWWTPPIPSGASGHHKLTPIPTTSRPSLRSTRIPPTFSSPRIRSLGHLSSSPERERRAATPAISDTGRVSSLACVARETARPAGAFIHAAPDRPLPSLCLRAITTTGRSASLSRARSWVDGVSSTCICK